jgi:hypothetical protein
MNSRLFAICLLSFALCSCGPTDQGGKPANDAKQASNGGHSAAPGDKSGMFWQLLDKSELKVVTDPWPPKAGSATLKAEVSANDNEEKFAGTLDYRLSPTEKSTAPWQPLSKVREDADKSVYFESPITLTAGTVYIQFRVRPAGEKTSDKDTLELNDWKVEVK